MSKATLFSEIVLRGGGKPEDIATDSLAYLLSSSGAARRELLEFINHHSGVSEIPPLTRVATQTSLESGCRPDMVASTSAGFPAVFIENKFWAGLTENQPNQYLDELSKLREPGMAAVLLFICPERAALMYGDELRRRLNSRDGIAPVVVGANPLVIHVGDQAAVMVSSWRIVLDLLARAAESDNDRQLTEDTNQLRGLIDRMDDDQAFLPLRAEELGADIGQRWHGLEQLQWKIAGILTGDEYSMGYVQNSLCVEIGGPGKWNAWIGLHLGLWAKFGRSPFWLEFHSKQLHFSFVERALGGWVSEVPARAVMVRRGKVDFLCIPLLPPLGVAKDEVLRELAEQVARVRGALIDSEAVSR